MDEVNDRPLISYVVTAYNIENYIAEAVQCAFDQTYSPLEIILSDDCSTDETFEIMKRMAASYEGPHKVVLNRNEINLGITRHMNKAYMELASGSIIVAAHGDDISKPDRVQLTWVYMRDHPDVTALSFGLEAFDDDGNLLETHSSYVNEIHEYSFDGGGNVPAPSRSFRKEVMTYFGPLGDDCPTEDELITSRALMLGKNVFLPEREVKYRKHEGSSSNPENFAHFPLEKILEQQDTDMRKGVGGGLITEEQRCEKYETLARGVRVRTRYREYFASRKLKDLIRLIAYNEVSPRAKVHYLREHIAYLGRR